MTQTETTGAGGADATLPDRLPVLPINGTVVFPGVVLPLALTDPALVALLRSAVEGDGLVALLTLRPGHLPTDEPAEGDASPFYDVATLGKVVHVLDAADGSLRGLVQGTRRLRARDVRKDADGWSAAVEAVAESGAADPRLPELRSELTDRLASMVSVSSNDSPAEAHDALEQVDEPGQLADMAAANLPLDLPAKQALLEEWDIPRRLERVLELLGGEERKRQFGSELAEKVKGEAERTQREFWLREQLKAIRTELGEGEESDAAELRRRLDAAGLPEPAREQAARELRRLERTQPQSPEYHVVRSYLEWMASLPWAAQAEEPIDLERARAVLDRDHYDLTPVKDRIIEYLAVRRLNPGHRGPILCLVGPPGVGKTSLGGSIADALGRSFARISLGGISDEAEVRGHRRTYVGALPGRILQAIRKAGVRNPVMLLDEVDKIGKDFRGDPAAALLEVLDPAQNHTFTDHYLEVEFDLSQVLFLATANSLTDVAPALLDRLEVLELPGYTEREKMEIARRHLIPRQEAEAGIPEGHFRISDEGLRALTSEYTREAGVRELERQIARIMRKLALQVVREGEATSLEITPGNLRDFTGKPRFTEELAGRIDEVGTATALAYTAAGGQILFVEAVGMPGGGDIRLTGHLGDVMRESAQAALSFLRAHAEELRIPPERFRDRDVHVHVPAGATPKDGPSAGMAMAVALASLFTGRPVKCGVAMTGEITLRGHVLPVGGIKEKLMAASRAGVDTVLLPRRNEADLADLPDEVQRALDFVLVDDVTEAFDRALVERRSRPREPRISVVTGTSGP